MCNTADGGRRFEATKPPWFVKRAHGYQQLAEVPNHDMNTLEDCHCSATTPQTVA
jgi:hypothetical protein